MAGLNVGGALGKNRAGGRRGAASPGEGYG